MSPKDAAAPAYVEPARVIAREPFIGMSRAAQIRHFETEGYVLLPNALTAAHVARLKSELAGLPMRASFYSDVPMFAKVPPHTFAQSAADLIGHQPVLAFLRELMGDDLVFMHSFYILSHPGTPAVDMHTDYQPYGSTYSGWLESCPVRVRVLYYLDDTRTDRSALRIVPRSHICFHADAQPYRRYVRLADEAVAPVNAGDAFVFAVRLFHGTGPNTTGQTRGMMEYDYRPAWSRPYQPVPEWTAEQMALVPESARHLTRPRNHLDFAWEFDAKRASVDVPAPGMSPKRWGDQD